MSGYQIPFHSVPVQLHVPVTKSSDLTVPLVDAEVNKLLSIGAIKAIPFSKENFYSRLFLVPKKEGTYRPVIDLSRLNKFIENSHFQMENISCLKTLLRRGDFMTCIDLKDAYLSVHVHKSSQKYLCFQWRNRCYAFLGLPFGLNTAPRVFTKLLKPVAAYLRKRGIRIIVYLDDFLILGSSIEDSKVNTQLTLDLLQWLGFTINWEKSLLVPNQSLTFLGLSIDSQTMSFSLPEKKILDIQNKCQSLIRNPTTPARAVASLIGTLEAARRAIWQAPLHYRQLQIQLIKSLQASRDNYETLMSLNSNARTELQWWLHNITTVNGSTINPPAPELYITSDASKAGWGACCQNLTANGRWSPLEAKDHINVLELKAAFLATKTFLKHHSNITVSPHGQYHSRCPHKQQRGYPFPSASEPNSRTMAVVPSKINSDHRSALTRQTQQCGRQRVKRVLRLQRMANRPTSDPALSKKVQCRSLCVTPNDSALNLRQLETRPRGYLHRCNDPRLVPSQRLRLSTIQSDRTSTEKSVTGQSRFGPSGPSMAGTTLVASPPEPVNQESCHDPKLQTPAEGPCVPSENPSNVPQASFSRLSVIREQHQTEGFSEDITRILQSATRASTHKTYQSAWGVWHSWCAKRQVNSISATLNDVLLFLTDRFNNGAAYRSVNVARSAISSCHAKIDGYPVGQHPLVIQLLKGMLNMRPPKPRYTHTWDVHLVTKYLSSLGKTKLLPLKLLSIKLAMLFALPCPERASSLAKLDLRHCRVAPEGVFFTLVSPRKRGSPDQLPQAFFASFPHNERLCPVGTLRHYLKATRNLRPVFPASKPDPLFVSYIKPHNPITTPTLSRWLRMVLKNAGINTDIFKAHSVRGASTTAAVNSNVPLDDVMKMADWSRVSTFQKFYYKPIFKANYAHSVLQ